MPEQKHISIYRPDKPNEMIDIIVTDPEADRRRAHEEALEEEKSQQAYLDLINSATEAFYDEYPDLLADICEERKIKIKGEYFTIEEIADTVRDPRGVFPDEVYESFEMEWWLAGNDLCDTISKEKAFYQKYGEPFLRPLEYEDKLEDIEERFKIKYINDYVGHKVLRYEPPMRECNYNPRKVPNTFSWLPDAVLGNSRGDYEYTYHNQFMENLPGEQASPVVSTTKPYKDPINMIILLMFSPFIILFLLFILACIID